MGLMVENIEKTDRVKVFSIDPHMLLTIFRNLSKGSYVKVTGVPSDARIVRHGMSPEGEIRFVLQSESFNPVAASAHLPELDVRVEIGPSND